MALEQWDFDLVHSNIGFVVRHLMVSKVHGKFTSWRGSLAFDAADPLATKVAVEIDANSIDTAVQQRDDHLRSGDFFLVAEHPKLTFKSTQIERAGDDKFKLTGDLTMRGVTKSITLDVDYGGRIAHPQRGQVIGFSAHTTINRKDWGVSFNQVLDQGGVAISDKVELRIEIEASRKAA